MSRSVGTTKGRKAKADRLFSQYIRSGGTCQRCHRHNHPRDPDTGLIVKGTDTVQLQCAHIASRRRLHSRWEPLNALCLCAGCHHWMTDYPVMFTAWVQHAYPRHYVYQRTLQELIEAPGRLPSPKLDVVIQDLTAWLDTLKCKTPTEREIQQ